MIIRDAYDALLISELTVYAAESLTGEHVINIAEPGGIDAAHLIITAEAASEPLTISVLGAEDKAGEFTPVEGLSFTTEANAEFTYRNRLPLHCPQFIKLQVQADAAPEAPAAVTLRIAV